jgi:hypothetical protein
MTTSGKRVMEPGPLSTASRPAVRRRWIVVGIAILLVLGAYAGALAWVGQRLEIDVQRSIHPVPAALAARHGE